MRITSPAEALSLVWAGLNLGVIAQDVRSSLNTGLTLCPLPSVQCTVQLQPVCSIRVLPWQYDITSICVRSIDSSTFCRTITVSSSTEPPITSSNVASSTQTSSLGRSSTTTSQSATSSLTPTSSVNSTPGQTSTFSSLPTTSSSVLAPGDGLPSGPTTDLPSNTFLALEFRPPAIAQIPRSGLDRRQGPTGDDTLSPIKLIPSADNCDSADPLLLQDGRLISNGRVVGKVQGSSRAVLGFLDAEENNFNITDTTFTLFDGAISWNTTDSGPGSFYLCDGVVYVGFEGASYPCPQIALAAVAGQACIDLVRQSRTPNPAFAAPSLSASSTNVLSTPTSLPPITSISANASSVISFTTPILNTTGPATITTPSLPVSTSSSLRPTETTSSGGIATSSRESSSSGSTSNSTRSSTTVSAHTTQSLMTNSSSVVTTITTITDSTRTSSHITSGSITTLNSTTASQHGSTLHSSMTSSNSTGTPLTTSTSTSGASSTTAISSTLSPSPSIIGYTWDCSNTYAFDPNDDPEPNHSCGPPNSNCLCWQRAPYNGPSQNGLCTTYDDTVQNDCAVDSDCASQPNTVCIVKTPATFGSGSKCVIPQDPACGMPIYADGYAPIYFND